MSSEVWIGSGILAALFGYFVWQVQRVVDLLQRDHVHLAEFDALRERVVGLSDRLSRLEGRDGSE